MYQNVYIDAVFAANFLMDYILLRLTGFFIREGRNRRRCLMAAAGGALFSSISLCIPAEQIPRMWGIVEIFCAAGMLILAYRIRSWKRLAMAVLIFYVLAFLSGGIWTEVMGNTRTTGVIFVLCALFCNRIRLRSRALSGVRRFWHRLRPPVPHDLFRPDALCQ